jgi:D-alanine-D-alanine ligase
LACLIAFGRQNVATKPKNSGDLRERLGTGFYTENGHLKGDSAANMAKKLRVGILFGGRSGEHEVSLLSAASVLGAIDREKFDVTPIGITKEGRWLAAADARGLLNGDAGAGGRQLRAGDPAVTPGAKLLHQGIPTLMAPMPGPQGPEGKAIEVVFPVLHGTFGEDGTIQGLFELAGIPYVGSGVLGSAAGMDKDVMKRLFAEAGLPIVKHVTLLRADWEKTPRKAISLIERALKYPVFVKPANLGSSVGISKAHDRAELSPALNLAAKYDRKLIVEQGVGGKPPQRRGPIAGDPGKAGRGGQVARAREFEVAVLGNDSPKASVVGEIIPGKEFYDYEAKYLSEGSVPVIPAKISRDQGRKIREMAVAAFKACDLAGLARVDFLMEPGGKQRIFLNEVNTMPGFTQISMYPKLWEATGLSYKDLITRLIELALERYAEKSKTSYNRED